jgi:hypothetical protein
MRKPDPAMRGPGRADPDAADPLILDLLQWLAPAPQPYAEVMARWRTSCPRLTVWEDAVDLGYVARRRTGSGPPVVEVTAAGRARLAR